MLSYTIYVVVAVASIGIFSDWIYTLFDDSKEPPRSRPRIPLIGHVLGLISHGGDYYVQLAAREKSEIYTLGFFKLKVYVINSRRLIPMVQRQAQNISFTPFAQFAIKAFTGASGRVYDIMGDSDFNRDLHKVHRESLSPGPYLDYQNLRANNSLNDLIDEKIKSGLDTADGSVRVGLHAWISHLITIAATDGVFGTNNPLLREEIRTAFWDWQKGALLIWAGMHWAVKKAVKAREKVAQAFTAYHQGDYGDAAEVIKQRAKIFQDYGASDADVARTHLFFLMGVLPNTVPASFWVVYEVFSRPEILHRLREAIIENAITRNDTDNSIELDVAALKTRVPLLLAVLEEMQRMRGTNASIRKIQEDTMLDKFLLKKGSFVQVPHQPTHYDSNIWGDDTDVYNPDRFFGRELPSNSLAPWGIAPHLCPARQFASTEMMVMVALLVLRLDIVPIGGKWRKLKLSPAEQTTIPPPKEELEVELRPRDGWNGKWFLNMGESRTKVQLSSG